MGKKVKRAAIYCRGEDSVYQAGIAATFIVDKGLSLHGLYTKEFNFYEPWSELIRDSERDLFDVIIVKNMNIFTEDTRKQAYQLSIPIICAEDLYCTNENLNVEKLEYKELKKEGIDPESYKIDENADPQKRLRQERIREILRLKLEERVLGLLPFGFFREAGKLIPDPAIAPVVEKIFVKAKDGERFTDIALWLEHEGVLNSHEGVQWSSNTIRDMLRNRIYYAKEIVSRDLFDAVQERFRRRKKPTERLRGEYQRIVFCETCHRAMSYRGLDKGTHRKTAFYFCKFHTGFHPKEKPFEHMPKIEEEVLKAEVLRQCNEYICRMTSDRDKLDEAVNRLEKKKKALDKKIENIGKRVLQHSEIPEKCAGLWNSWIEAQNNYRMGIDHRALLLRQYKIYRTKPIADHDYEVEREFIRSITVDANGSVSIQFLGDYLFGL